eukprot:765115-Hanusia_phi.AAC.1
MASSRRRCGRLSRGARHDGSVRSLVQPLAESRLYDRVLPVPRAVPPPLLAELKVLPLVSSLPRGQHPPGHELHIGRKDLPRDVVLDTGLQAVSFTPCRRVVEQLQRLQRRVPPLADLYPLPLAEPGDLGVREGSDEVVGKLDCKLREVGGGERDVEGKLSLHVEVRTALLRGELQRLCLQAESLSPYLQHQVCAARPVGQVLLDGSQTRGILQLAERAVEVKGETSSLVQVAERPVEGEEERVSADVTEVDHEVGEACRGGGDVLAERAFETATLRSSAADTGPPPRSRRSMSSWGRNAVWDEHSERGRLEALTRRMLLGRTSNGSLVVTKADELPLMTGVETDRTSSNTRRSEIPAAGIRREEN